MDGCGPHMRRRVSWTTFWQRISLENVLSWWSTIPYEALLSFPYKTPTQVRKFLQFTILDTYLITFAYSNFKLLTLLLRCSSLAERTLSPAAWLLVSLIHERTNIRHMTARNLSYKFLTDSLPFLTNIVGYALESSRYVLASSNSSSRQMHPYII